MKWDSAIVEGMRVFGLGPVCLVFFVVPGRPFLFLQYGRYIIRRRINWGDTEYHEFLLFTYVLIDTGKRVSRLRLTLQWEHAEDAEKGLSHLTGYTSIPYSLDVSGKDISLIFTRCKSYAPGKICTTKIVAACLSRRICVTYLSHIS